MRVSFVTLFESLIRPYFSESILNRALEKGLLEIDFYNPRDDAIDKYKKVDEYQAGGGAGLLMKPDVLDRTLTKIEQESSDAHFIFVLPVAKPFTQSDAKRLSSKEHLVLVSGRYEGIDERIIEKWADELFSIGDFILTGGELPSLCIVDAVSRNIDGVLGNSDSLEIESFETPLLEAPAFTKPNLFEKSEAPKEYLKGNHSKIHDLKVKLSECKTKYFRPDLYQKAKTIGRIEDEK